MGMNDEIKQAVADHGKWKNTLKKAIDTGKFEVDIITLKNDSHCNFGKWLYGSAITEEDKKSRNYQKVHELHVAFHEKAAKVAQLAISGKKAAAEKMLGLNGEFTTASAALTTSMLAWLNETK